MPTKKYLRKSDKKLCLMVQIMKVSAFWSVDRNVKSKKYVPSEKIEAV